MSQDFWPCPKCESPMPAPDPAYQYIAPNVTWRGMAVCRDCTEKLERVLQKYQEPQR